MSGTAWWGEGERTGVSHRRDWGFDPLRLAVRRRTLGDRACISLAMKDLAACVYDGRRLAKMQPGS
jgi:hypothetical protein